MARKTRPNARSSRGTCQSHRCRRFSRPLLSRQRMPCARCHELLLLIFKRFYPERTPRESCRAFYSSFTRWKSAGTSRDFIEFRARTDHADRIRLGYLQDGRRRRRGLGTSHEEFKSKRTELSLTHEKHSGSVAIQSSPARARKINVDGTRGKDPWSRQIEPYFRKIGGPIGARPSVRRLGVRFSR